MDLSFSSSKDYDKEFEFPEPFPPNPSQARFLGPKTLQKPLLVGTPLFQSQFPSLPLDVW